MTFREKLNEAENNNIKELESKLSKLNPTKYIKEAIIAMKDSWYWSSRPAINLYAEQNNLFGSYSKDSLYDVFIHYRYGIMSKSLKNYIDEKIPLKSESDWSTFVKEWKFNDNGKSYTFKVNISYDRILKKIKKDENVRLVLIDNPEVLGSLTINGKKVAWGTYRTRDMISPSSVIDKTELLKLLNKPIIEYNNSIIYTEKLRMNVVLVMVNEVVKSYIVDTTKVDDLIKNELENAQNITIYRSILSKYEFENIPADDDVIEGLMKSKKFSYTVSRPDGYGHTPGTLYTLPFRTRTLILDIFSSAASSPHHSLLIFLLQL